MQPHIHAHMRSQQTILWQSKRHVQADIHAHIHTYAHIKANIRGIQGRVLFLRINPVAGASGVINRQSSGEARGTCNDTCMHTYKHTYTQKHTHTNL